MPRKHRLFLLLSACLLWVLPGCGGTPTEPATNAATQGGGSKAGTALTIVTPHADSIRREYEALWKAKHPESSIQWLNPGGSSDLLTFVLDQYRNKANKDEGIGTDVFFGGGPETFLQLEEEHLLSKLPQSYNVPASLNGVSLRGRDNAWVGAVLSGFGILYNKKIAQRDKLPVPVVWADLGKKELRDRIELADPRKSGSAHAAYEVILQVNGWENGWKILTSMAANSRAFLDSSSRLVDDVSNGEAVFAPSIDFYARSKIAAAGEEKLGYVAPAGQSVVTPDPIGVLRGTRNKKLAEEFVAMVLSPEGQKLWMLAKGAPGGPKQDALYRAPILPSLYKPIPRDSLIKQDPYSVKNVRRYDDKKAAGRRLVVDDMIGAIIIDNHDALRQRQKDRGDTINLSLAPSEADVREAAKKWNDPIFVQQKLSEWRDAARDKIAAK